MACADLARPGVVAVEHGVGDAGAARLGEEVGAEADQPAGRHPELHADPTGSVVVHLVHATLTRREQLGHRTEVLLGDVDRQVLEWLVHLAVDLARDHLRLADGQLEVLASHLLDEDREGELTTTLHLPGVGPIDVDDAQRHVADELAVEAILDHARGELVALHPTGERRGVGADDDRDGRLVDGDARQGNRVLGIGEGVADHDLGDTGDGHDVACDRRLRRTALHADGCEQFGDLGALDDRLRGAVLLGDLTHPGDGLALLEGAVVDTDQPEAAEERRGVEVGDVRLQRSVRVALGRGDVLHQDVEEGVEVLALGYLAVRGLHRAGDACAARGVQDREVEDLLGSGGGLVVEVGGEVEQQIVGLGDNLRDARVRTVGLVDQQDDRQRCAERLAQHEAGLRERTLGRVDEQHDAVDHRQAALDLAAEVGVTGGVDDVDDDLGAVGLTTMHRGVLRENGDALLAFEVSGVHHAIDELGTLTEHSGLAEHRVDQRGLAMVDVRDDRDIAEVGDSAH